jgi:hypothetical protein
MAFYGLCSSFDDDEELLYEYPEVRQVVSPFGSFAYTAPPQCHRAALFL